MAAVDQWEPGFQRAIRSSRLQGPEALLAGVFPPGEFDLNDDRTIAEYMLERLDRTVGGRLMLRNLTEEPLPDDPFEWAGVPDDVHDRVRARPRALRRLRRRAARRRAPDRDAPHAQPRRGGDPQLPPQGQTGESGGSRRVGGRSRQRVRRTYRGTLQVQQLLAWFGVHGSISQRAEVFLKAIGVKPYDQSGQMDLGAPDLLVAERRGRIIALRDRYLEES